VWNNTTTTVTSLSIASTQASSLTSSNSIGAGSEFLLYRAKRTRDGAQGELVVQDEGTSIETSTGFIDFAGSGVTATASGIGGIRVEIPEVVSRVVLSSAATTISLTGLDGDAHEKYEIIGRLKMGITSAHDILLAPNGSTASDRPTNRYFDSGTPTATSNGTLLANGSVTTAVRINFTMQAFVGRGDTPRSFYYDGPEIWDTSSVGIWKAVCFYTDETSNLTTLDFVCSVTNGFAAGSWIEVRRV